MDVPSLFLFLSNFFFFIPAYRAFVWGRFLRSALYGIIPFTSGSYHICDSYSACLFSYATHHYLDFVVATLMVPQSSLYFIRWRWNGDYEDLKDSKTQALGVPFLEKWFIVFFVLVTAIVVALTTGDIQSQSILAGAGLFVTISYWIGYLIVYKTFPRYDWFSVLGFMSFTGISLLYFSYQDSDPDSYWAVHSLWHACSALGQDYLIRIKPSLPAYLNAETPIRDVRNNTRGDCVVPRITVKRTGRVTKNSKSLLEHEVAWPSSRFKTFLGTGNKKTRQQKSSRVEGV